jgi:hypothetical protein
LNRLANVDELGQVLLDAAIDAAQLARGRTLATLNAPCADSPSKLLEILVNVHWSDHVQGSYSVCGLIYAPADGAPEIPLQEI